MRFILLLISFLFCHFSFADNADVLIKKHPLLNKTVTTPDFTLVIEGTNESYSLSPIQKNINASLLTLGNRFSILGFPTQGLIVKKVLPTGTKLEVTKVYRSEPSLLRSFFTQETFFATVTDEKGKRYTVSVSNDKILFELNACRVKRCLNWKTLMSSIFNSKNDNHQIQLTYQLIDAKQMVSPKKLRPPYPEGMLERSQKNLLSFLKKHNIEIKEINKHHPYLIVKVNLIQYSNLLLNHETLGITLVSLSI